VGGVTGLAAAQAYGVGPGGFGAAALNPATSLLTGTYSQFDAKGASSQSVSAPSGAPKGAGFGRNAPPGATADNKSSLGPTYQAQERPANLSLFASERGALADAADYLPNPIHDLPPAARAAMNRGYVYSGMFILGGGGAGRLAGWALARLGIAISAEGLLTQTATIANNGQRMLAAARILSAMRGMSAGQKVTTMLGFFRGINFAINAENGVIAEAEGSFLMYSEDMKYAFRFTADRAISYGKFSIEELEYLWTKL